MLERLGPVERAVFLMADVFAVPFAEVGTSWGSRRRPVVRSPGGPARRSGEAAGRPRPAGGPRSDRPPGGVPSGPGTWRGCWDGWRPSGPHRRRRCHGTRRPAPGGGAPRVARLLVNLARRSRGARPRPVKVNGDPGFVLSMTVPSTWSSCLRWRRPGGGGLDRAQPREAHPRGASGRVAIAGPNTVLDRRSLNVCVR